MRFGVNSFVWASPFSGRTLPLLGHARRLGFDLFEVAIEDPATIDPPAIRQAAAEAGIGLLVCGAFGPARDISADDAATRENGVAYLRQCVDIAVALGSPIVAGPMYSATGKARLLGAAERAAQHTLAVENMKRAGAYAAERGIRLAVEPLNRFETDFLNTVEQGLAFFDRIGLENVGFLLDTFHMNIEEKSIPGAIRAAGGKAFHLHACANDRGTPGEDNLDWPAIVQALHDISYDGAVVIESFTPEIREIARAVSMWRPLAESQDALAGNGLRFLRQAFG